MSEPVTVGSTIHVPAGDGWNCQPAIVTEISTIGTIDEVSGFPGPYQNIAVHDAKRRHDTTQGASMYTWHRLEECPRRHVAAE